MADNVVCSHCGFIFEDPNMKICPRCGTEAKKTEEKSREEAEAAKAQAEAAKAQHEL